MDIIDNLSRNGGNISRTARDMNLSDYEMKILCDEYDIRRDYDGKIVLPENTN